jgi:hypothetical protein
MSVGIPGIGIGALFYVISALLMVVLELYRTIRGRSSLARWRVVGHQAAIAVCIILLTVVALWSLHLIVPASAYLDIRLGNAQGTGVGAGPSEPLVAALTTISTMPMLGTLVFLALVFCLAEAMPWVAGRAQSLPGSLHLGEGLAPRKQRAAPESAYLDIQLGNAQGTGAGAGRGAAGSYYRWYLMAYAALLVVAVGTASIQALALILIRDNYPEVSQVREPLISQTPSHVSSHVSRVGGEENERAWPQQEDKEQSADGKDDNHRPEQHNGPSHAGTEGDRGPVRTGQDQGGHLLAQGPRSVTPTQSAPPSAQKEPAAAKPEAASTLPPAEVPAQITATGVPVKGSGRGETGNIFPGSQDGDRFDMQIRVGTDDPVRITGNPVATRKRFRTSIANGAPNVSGLGGALAGCGTARARARCAGGMVAEDNCDATPFLPCSSRTRARPRAPARKPR